MGRGLGLCLALPRKSPPSLRYVLLALQVLRRLRMCLSCSTSGVLKVVLEAVLEVMPLCCWQWVHLTPELPSYSGR